MDIMEHQARCAGMPYYLGSLILHRSANELNIIDGQQRLTTLALLAHLQGQFPLFPLRYSSSISQMNITHNLTWLATEYVAPLSCLV